MKTLKTTLIIFCLSLSTLLSAKMVNLPLGGRVDLDLDEWKILETKEVTGFKSMMLVHKSQKELKGFIMDGTIREKQVCKGASKVQDWSTCHKEETVKHEINHRILLERKIGDKTYQNYLITFNYPENKKQVYGPLMSKIIKGRDTK